ncbi:hypothetical protein KCV87_29580 [Actinosynnema pretiosum subsp. pretiosum]|uniref:ATP-grasp domain-containing protein n=1 Tax=Actinosynnema pretiosum subsp. pretiosum TaxID=103721 RepID=A0AA45R362_9PSEU|nr:hypothetical protein APASM_5224 [Actinosynnema pretiosum subsp. pretiosum]QUF03512.1 hypothetical protein KCV87_29580 [Actinosynnema pretiosum subsp. pretiosum]
MKVVLSTCDPLPDGDVDDAPLVGALADLGVHAEFSVWDAGPAAASADLVVLRSPWDYPEKLDAFLPWADSLPALANPAHVVRWNADKAYLVELASDGVAVVPTALATPGFADWPRDVEFVVKPTVGSGSRGALRVAPNDVATAERHLAELAAPALVQPYQSGVDSAGETALVFFAGRYSHAFTKGAMLTEDAVYDETGLYLLERLGPAAPPAAYRRLAEDVLDAATARCGLRRSELLYARVDLIPGPGGAPLLLELELVEPALGFRQADAGAPLRFASAIRAALAGC